ncbi:hypothetical protein KDL01_04530 [Actinospica durhamensis]|uniref:Adenylosuccinate lyase C-terminal domain-containing protein n=1 Tax=Actinospica durhamensis TaxID=1508375 RepID=A0A941EKH0_9ACTN|nr:lyase family protein [Actinospica durhamensis]MBR7832510.1 hypothetical protein [Actinospica durhamensis]
MRVLEDSGLLSPVRAGTAVEAAVSDEAWLQAMLDAEAALARAQARLGAVPPDAAAAVTAAARAEKLDLRAVATAARENANPVVALVRALGAVVRAEHPEAAQYVHRGSTSQDVFDTGAMLVCARALRIIRADLARVAQACAVLALAHRDTAIAGRTLALHAVPTTFGLKAAGWRSLVLDADHRLGLLLDRKSAQALPVSLGGAAGTLSGYLAYAPAENAPAENSSADSLKESEAFDIDGIGEPYHVRLVAAFADETGLAPQTIPWHALRTPTADLAAALGFTAGALGKIAADVQSLVRTEVGELAEPGPAGRGASSAMPHKRNPVLATLIRSAAIQVPAYASVLLHCAAAEDERSAGAWHAEWLPLRECLRLAGGAAQAAVELTEGLEVRPDRMRRNLGLTRGQLVSERVAAVLAPELGKDEARALVTEACLKAADSGEELAEVLRRGLGHLPHDLEELCDPANFTGAAAELVDRALAVTGE